MNLDPQLATPIRPCPSAVRLWGVEPTRTLVMIRNDEESSTTTELASSTLT
jgi:hypothetical protein